MRANIKPKEGEKKSIHTKNDRSISFDQFSGKRDYVSAPVVHALLCVDCVAIFFFVSCSRSGGGVVLVVFSVARPIERVS